MGGWEGGGEEEGGVVGLGDPQRRAESRWRNPALRPADDLIVAGRCGDFLLRRREEGGRRQGGREEQQRAGPTGAGVTAGASPRKELTALWGTGSERHAAQRVRAAGR